MTTVTAQKPSTKHSTVTDLIRSVIAEFPDMQVPELAVEVGKQTPGFSESSQQMRTFYVDALGTKITHILSQAGNDARKLLLGTLTEITGITEDDDLIGDLDDPIDEPVIEPVIEPKKVKKKKKEDPNDPVIDEPASTSLLKEYWDKLLKSEYFQRKTLGKCARKDIRAGKERRMRQRNGLDASLKAHDVMLDLFDKYGLPEEGLFEEIPPQESSIFFGLLDEEDLI